MTAKYTLNAWVEVVPSGADAPTRVTITTPVQHLCPFKNETDNGQATISWVAHATTIELHSLQAALGNLQDWEVSHEGFTAYLTEGIKNLGFHSVHVTTTWDTAGMTVTVER